MALLLPGADSGGGAPAPDTPLTILGGASFLKSWRMADAGTFEDDAGATPAADDGDPVGQWQDQSGNGNHYSQATGAAKPSLQLAEQNSLPCVRFDGLGTYLQRAIHLSGSSGFMFAVLRMTSHVSGETVFSFGDNGGTARYLQFGYGATATDRARIIQRNNDTTDNIDGDSVLNTAATYIIVAYSDGSAWKMLVNGAAQTFTINGGANNGDWAADTDSLDVASIGALGRSSVMNFWHGDVMEMGEGDGTITDQQAADLSANLNEKWAVY
jgi:hypothetical protein